jgi:hypothetical protein
MEKKNRYPLFMEEVPKVVAAFNGLSKSRAQLKA